MFNVQYETIRVAKHTIPGGAKLVEAYETEQEIIVLGDPPHSDDEESGHNCDWMGCGTLSHVLYRFRKPTATPPAAPDGG